MQYKIIIDVAAPLPDSSTQIVDAIKNGLSVVDGAHLASVVEVAVIENDQAETV